MAVYSERYRYIFFANPQTASKAVAKTLRDSLEGRTLRATQSKRGGRIVDKPHHLSWQQVQDLGLMTGEQLNRLVKLTGVRNPYDTLVSRYLKHRERFVEEADKYPWVQKNDKVQASMTAARDLNFPEWLIDQYQHHADKGKTVSHQSKFLNHADIILRFESLQADFDAFLRRIGVTESIRIVSLNVTSQRVAAGGCKKRHYTEFYDDASRELVTNIYGPIIKRFGYRFDD